MTEAEIEVKMTNTKHHNDMLNLISEINIAYGLAGQLENGQYLHDHLPHKEEVKVKAIQIILGSVVAKLEKKRWEFKEP